MLHFLDPDIVGWVRPRSPAAPSYRLATDADPLKTTASRKRSTIKCSISRVSSVRRGPTSASAEMTATARASTRPSTSETTVSKRWRSSTSGSRRRLRRSAVEDGTL